MQEINQKKINLILPKATCIFMIILNFVFYILLLTKEKESNLLFIIYIIVYIIIYFLINDTLKNNNYSTYTKTICVSLSFTIFFTFGKFIAIVILLEVGVNIEDVIVPICICLVWILLDWILPIILLYYRSKVKNLCLNNSQNMILNNNLVQTNLIITQNVNYNMQNNNQNSNYVQPYVPNLNTNVQSNEQQFNTPNVQPYYINSNDRINNQNLDAPSNIQNLGASNVQSNPQNLNNNGETTTGN
jgi:hypothetical protein